MQFSIYDINCNKLKIKNPVRLIEFFAGFGSQYISLKEISKEKNIVRIGGAFGLKYSLQTLNCPSMLCSV